MHNPHLGRKKGKAVGDAGRASERKLARRLKGRATPASGALPGAKGDVVLASFLLEAKSTMKDSISLKLNWLLKIGDEAFRSRKTPALAVTFTKKNGDPYQDGSWVMIPEKVFSALVESGAIENIDEVHYGD